MVKDINPEGNGSSASAFANVNGTVFFVGNDNIHGSELWKSDGTETGTALVKDILSGNLSSFPSAFINFNSALFFSARSGTNGFELWRTDGTEAGIVLIKAIHPTGGNFSGSQGIFNLNGTLFFFVFDDTNGGELWKSDGTADGTVPVSFVNDKILPGSFADPVIFAVEDVLCFIAYSDNIGQELLLTDGTEEGTLALDINPGPGSSILASHLTIGEVFFFSVNDGTHGFELWKFERGMQKQAVTSFTLVNADTDTDILELTQGMQLNFNELPNAKLNIRANTHPPTVGSVFLQLSGKIKAKRKEKVAPYTLFGDNNGQNLRLSEYTITAIPYSKADLKGEKGKSLSLNFSIVDNQPSNARIAFEDDVKKGNDMEGEKLLLLPQKSWVYPNPFTHTFTVELSDFSGKTLKCIFLIFMENP